MRADVNNSSNRRAREFQVNDIHFIYFPLADIFNKIRLLMAEREKRYQKIALVEVRNSLMLELFCKALRIGLGFVRSKGSRYVSSNLLDTAKVAQNTARKHIYWPLDLIIPVIHFVSTQKKASHIGGLCSASKKTSAVSVNTTLELRVRERLTG